MAGWGDPLRAACAAVAALVVAVPAIAANIAVVPIRIELAPGAKYCSLHVSNQGADDVAIQVRGFAWSQASDGSEELGAADIRVNPAIFELKPGEKRLVRCSLPAHSGPNESSYRLLVDELPRGDPQPGTMRTLLRISLPIFRKPAGAAPSLHWQAGPGGALQLLNTGQRHAVVGKLLVSRAGQPIETVERGFYLLAGKQRSIPLTSVRGEITKVEAVTGEGQLKAVSKLPE